MISTNRAGQPWACPGHPDCFGVVPQQSGRRDKPGDDAVGIVEIRLIAEVPAFADQRLARRRRAAAAGGKCQSAAVEQANVVLVGEANGGMELDGLAAHAQAVHLRLMSEHARFPD